MKSLRNQLNLTQEELAGLIGVSRSTITLYEKGLRNLPAKCGLKLAQLQGLLLQNKRKKMMPNKRLMAQQQKQYSKMEKKLNGYANKAAAQAARMSLKLSRMQERYEQLTQKLELVQVMMEDATPGTREMLLLQNMELGTLAAMKQCDPPRQMLAGYRLELLQALQHSTQVMKQATSTENRADAD